MKTKECFREVRDQLSHTLGNNTNQFQVFVVLVGTIGEITE